MLNSKWFKEIKFNEKIKSKVYLIVHTHKRWGRLASTKQS